MATAKKSAAKKSVVKKAAPAKKAVAKKAVAKKATPVKKAVAKKATPVKKAVAKKATPVKKAVAKKATPVKSSPRNTTNLAVRVPEVPRILPAQRTQSATINPLPAQRAEFAETKSRSSNIPLWFALLALGISIVYFIAQRSDANTQSSSAPNAVETASPTPSATFKQSETKESESKSITAASLSAKPEFLYTSTGIEISWSTSGFNTYSSVTLLSSVNNAPFIELTRGESTLSSFALTKEDTVGQTRFKLVFTTSEGAEITSSPLSVRGLFSK